jgi:diguanylate cyclase (GGDEF)-like protein/PAS domain S-box-containing protein
MKGKLTITALIAALYFLSSVAVLNIFAEPSLSAAIWPAAGIGVGAVLLWGRAALPGIILGEVLNRFYLSGTDWLTHFRDGYWVEILLVLIAVFRAFFSAWLASRVVKFPDPLIRYRNVFLFFLTAGVVATVFSTVFYILLRYATGNLPPGSMLQNFFLWWTGDAVGILLFTPIMLLLFARPRRIWKPRLAPVAIPIVVVLLLMVVLLQVVRNQEESRIVDLLKIKTTFLARALEQKLNWHSELLYLFKSHFPDNGHRPMNQEAFARFAQRAMKRFPQMKEVIWVPAADDTEFDPGATPVFTGLGAHHVSSFAASGMSAQTIQAALRTGSDEKHTDVYARKVMPVPGMATAYLSMLPVYRHSDTKPVGQLLSVFDLSSIVEAVTNEIGLDDVSVMVTDNGQDQILYKSKALYDDSEMAGMSVSVPLKTGFESPWQLKLVPHLNYFKNNFSWSAWGILSGGLAFASFLGIGLLGSTGRTFLTEEEVRKRTRELDAANKALALSRDKYESLVQTQPVILWRVDIKKDQFIFVSNEAQRVLGYDLQDWFTVPHFWKAITHEDDRFECEKIIAEGIAHKTQFTMEHRVFDRFGDVHWIRNVIRVIRENGKPVELVGLMIDITSEKMAQDKLQISEQRFRTLFDFAYEAIVIIDLDSKVFIEANEKALKLYGMRTDDLGKKGPLHFSPPLQPNGKPSRELAEHYMGSVKQKGHVQFEWLHIDAEGREFLCEVNLVDMPSKERNLIRGSVFDITHRREHEEKLRIAATTFETHDAIIIADREGKTLQVNRAFCQMTGYSEEEAVGASAFRLLPDSAQENKKKILQALQSTGRYEGEIWCRKKNGQRFLAWHTITGVRDDSGKVTHFVSVFSDVTAKKAAENKIRKLAYTDPLTGLPNRQYFHERLERLFQKPNKDHPYAGLIYIDLDRFKVLNDSKGHHFGDRFLHEVGQRIRKALGSQDISARLAGDEFVVLTQFFELERSAQAYARHLAGIIREKLSEPYVIEGYEHHSSASLGVRVFNLEEDNPQIVLQQADAAMYRSKQGRNRITFFEEEMIQDANTRLHIEDSLRKAVAENNLELYFQPIVNRDRQVVSMEALARWKIANDHFINPEVFIPLAEEIGIIDKVGEWVLNEACAQMRAWLDDGRGIHSIAINVSSKQFHNPGFGEEIQQALDKYQLEPEHLTVEITEGTAIDDLDTALAQMNRLKLLGVQLAMDDFGTGYSSLAYLRQMPLNQLKIDKSFVRDAMTDKSARVIIETIIDMGRHLDLEVVAEGVETVEQFEFLRNTGCSLFQGYLFYRPAKPEHLFQSVSAKG